MKKRSAFSLLFSIVMVFFVCFMVWYLPAFSSRSFRLDDVRESLKTSQGREKKQQYEYDETVAAIPLAQAELDRVLPLSEAARDELKQLKKERKALKNEKKELVSAGSSDVQEVTEDE